MVLRIENPDDPRLVDYHHLNDAAARAAAGRDGTPGSAHSPAVGIDTGCAIVEGAVALDGRMIDRPHVKQAERILAALERR